MALDEGACLTARALRRRLPLAGRETYARGRTIVFRGELPSKLFLIERGRAHASYETGLGPTSLSLRPGDFFGEIGVLEALPSDCVVEAASAEVAVLAVPVASFRLLLAHDEAIQRLFLERTAERRTALGAALLGWRGFHPSAARAAMRPS